jgi:hypothetical protein
MIDAMMVSELTQAPIATSTVTVSVCVKVTEDVVAPVLHKYEVPPTAVRSKKRLFPQTNVSVGKLYIGV